jgi:hypothetical protein
MTIGLTPRALTAAPTKANFGETRTLFELSSAIKGTAAPTLAVLVARAAEPARSESQSPEGDREFESVSLRYNRAYYLIITVT